MDSRQPGSPTSPYYPPVTTPAAPGRTEDTDRGQMGHYSTTSTNAPTNVSGIKRSAGSDQTSELPERKVIKSEPTRPPAVSGPTAADIMWVYSQTQNTALTTAWIIQRLQSTQSGYNSTLIPSTYQSGPSRQMQPFGLPVKIEERSSSPELRAPLLSELPPPIPHKVPDWLKTIPSDPPLAAGKRPPSYNLDDAITPVTPGKKPKKSNAKKAPPQKRTMQKSPLVFFNDRAQTLSDLFPDHPLNAKKLWRLCDSTPSIAASHYLGNQKFDQLPYSEKMTLIDILTKARSKKKISTCPELESASGSEPAKPKATSPALSSAISEVSSGTGYSTASTILSQWSSAIDIKPTFSMPTTFLQPSSLSLIRAVLTNPNGNRCFINATIHYLKAVLSAEEQSKLVNLTHLSEAHKEKIDPAVMALAHLYQAMDEYEGGILGAKQKVTSKLDALVLCCLEHSHFSPCVRTKSQRQTSTDSKLTPEQQLRKLEHEDASSFYMPVWGLLRSLIPSLSQISLYQEMQTTHEGVTFTKKPHLDKTIPNADGCEPFIAVKFDNHQNLQTAIDDYFATEAPGKDEEDRVHWDSQPHPTNPAITLPEGYHPTSKTYRLGAHGFLNRLHLRFEVQSYNGGASKLPVCKTLRQQVFDNIRLPVDDLDTGSRHQVDATPLCIIVHTGSDLKSGHYVTLEKTEQGWLLHDDGKPATLLEDPVKFLQSKPFYDPYLVAYETV